MGEDVQQAQPAQQAATFDATKWLEENEGQKLTTQMILGLAMYINRDAANFAQSRYQEGIQAGRMALQDELAAHGVTLGSAAGPEAPTPAVPVGPTAAPEAQPVQTGNPPALAPLPLKKTIPAKAPARKSRAVKKSANN